MRTRSKTAAPLPTVALRLSDADRRTAELHGHGELGDGMRTILERHEAIMRRNLPALAAEEAKAICGALKGYPLWCAPELCGRMPLGQALAAELHDYPRCEATEAAQWKLAPAQWRALEARVAAMTDIEVLAIAHAVEAMFADRDGDLDTVIARHFRP